MDNQELEFSLDDILREFSGNGDDTEAAGNAAPGGEAAEAEAAAATPEEKSEGGSICELETAPAAYVALDETVRRVSYMERLMDEVMAARKDESRTWPWFRMRQLRVLEDYYENGLWRMDFETDEKGLLPRGLKRGVLSEDGLYDLLTDAWDERKACQRKKQERAE